MKNNFIRVLKMTAFYSLLGLLLQGLLVNILFASGSSEGQNLRSIKVTMNVQNVTLEDAILTLEKNSNFKFVYLEEEIPLNERVTIDVTNESLYDLLKGLAGEYGLIFQRINNQIVIKKGEYAEVTEKILAPETGSIKGKVTDAKTGEPLIGANITLKGTTIGTATDRNGNYKFEDLKPGQYSVLFQYVGYSSKSEMVNVEANKTVELNASLGQTAYNLDEVTVTGSISERSYRESSTTHTVITPKQLENRNLTSLADVLQSVPSILNGYLGASNYWQSDTRANNLSLNYLNMRGFASDLQLNSGTKFILDGVELYNASAILNLNPDQIEKIEISLGPMSTTLYGSGAANGIIQVFTKKGYGNLSGNFKTTFISKDEKYQIASPLIQDFSFGLRGGIDNFGFTLGAQYYHSPVSRYMNYNINENDWNISAGINGRFSKVELDVNFQYTNNRYPGILFPLYYYVALEEGWPNANTLNDDYITEWSYQTKFINIGLNLKHVLSDKIYHKLTLGYVSGNTFGNDAIKNTSPYTGGEYYTSTSSFRNTQALKYFINYKEELSTNFKIEFTGGAELTRHEYPNTLALFEQKFEENKVRTYSSETGYFEHMTAETKGFFGEAVLGYQNDFFLTAGYRTEQNTTYGKDIGWFSIPRLGATYIASFGDFTIKPRIAWGASTQPLDPVMATGQLIDFGFFLIEQLPNPELKPQEEIGYEIGTDIFFTQNISFGITYYNQVLKNLIEYETIELTDVSQSYHYVNRGKVNKKGLELNLKAIYDPFSFTFGYTTVSSKYGEGAPKTPDEFTPYFYEGGLTYDTPKGSYFAQLSYSIPSFLPWSDKGGNITLEYKWTDGSINMNNYERYKNFAYTGRYIIIYEESSPYSFVNLRTNYNILNDVVFFVDIQNLLNSQKLIGNSFFQKGRKIAFGLDINF